MNPKCPVCERALVNRLFDRCLYCGTILPEALCLPEEEKARIREETLHQLEEEHKIRVEIERTRRRIEMERD